MSTRTHEIKRKEKQSQYSIICLRCFTLVAKMIAPFSQIIWSPNTISLRSWRKPNKSSSPRTAGKFVCSPPISFDIFPNHVFLLHVALGLLYALNGVSFVEYRAPEFFNTGLLHYFSQLYDVLLCPKVIETVIVSIKAN